MGKIKTSKNKLHITAPKLSQFDSPFYPTDNATELINATGDVPQFSGVNIFQNIDIPSNVLQQKIQDFDARSILSTISTKRHITKKEKRELRHEAFMQKLEARRVAEQKMKDEKKRKQTPVVGDLRPLSEALPLLDELLKRNVKEIKPVEKPYRSKKFKQQQAASLQDIQAFQQVQQHPSFKENPFSAMSTHLKSLLDAKQL